MKGLPPLAMLAHDRKFRRIAYGLAGLAGFVDALGFLSLGGMFVSFMSGNSTRFGVGLAVGIPLHLALLPLGLIGLFVIGVMIGKVIRHHRRREPSFSVLVFMVTSLAAAALFHHLHLPVLTMSLMAIAMGSANNVFVREGEVAIGVTYMTGTLVKLGQRLAGRMIGEPKGLWFPYFLLWAALTLGAVLGAFSFAWIGLNALWIAAFLTAILAALFWPLERRQV